MLQCCWSTLLTFLHVAYFLVHAYNLLMRTILALIMILSQPVVAHEANTAFDATKNQYSSVEITWVASSDVQKSCEKVFKQRGTPLTYKVDACSFWIGNKCTIITKTAPTNDDVGHEVRHCFQFNWH